LSDAVERFRASGKDAIAWAETFGELGRGTTAYVLASGFGEVWLQPSGSVGLMGASATGVFVRGALDRAHVEPLFAQRHEYKSAVDSLLRTEFSEAHREATERLAASTYEQIVSTVAERRRLSEDRVRELIDRAPISAVEAHEAGLVDHLGYRDAVRAAVDHRWGEKPTLLYLSRYRRRWDRVRRARHARRPAVALIQASGAIRTGRSRRGPFGQAAGADTVAAAFRSAVRDERTRAIVFRVNSPGGSYVASDTIWHEVCLAREAGKPVVVSMGDVAGSGGYFVAMAADVIVAQPATLTGAIGVFGGKLQASGLFEQLGVRVESLARGRQALMFSSQTGFSEEEWVKLNEWLDLVYDDFTDKVAAGRAMTRDAVHEVARGRVWTGADAAERARRRAPGLTIECGLEPTLVRGEGDRIARAVANLLDNAAKWSPPGGVVEVELRGGTLTVRDHGPGFHEDDLPFVFDRFHRAKAARSKPGSGLGLAIVRQAAEAHGGFVEARNAPGGGALLRISFGEPLELEPQSLEPISAP